MTKLVIVWEFDVEKDKIENTLREVATASRSIDREDCYVAINDAADKVLAAAGKVTFACKVCEPNKVNANYLLVMDDGALIYCCFNHADRLLMADKVSSYEHLYEKGLDIPVK